MIAPGMMASAMSRRSLLMALAATPERAIPLRLPLRAADAEGLKAEDVQLTANGAPVKVRALTAGPLVLNVVLDLAGDLTQAGPARAALVEQIAKTTATVALLRAQDGLRVLADPGTPKEKLTAEIEALNVSGRAGLLDTVVPAATLTDALLRATRVRSAVLYVSDSLITNYREDYTNPVVNSSDANDMSRRFPEGLVKEKIRQLKEELAGTLAPLFVVHLNYQSDRLNEAYQTGLMDLAQSSGGEAWFCRTLADIAPNINKAFALAATLYVADLEAAPAKGRQIEIASQGARGLLLRTRYVVPKAPPKKKEK